MAFGGGHANPEWNRDEEEYKDLNAIEDMVRWHSQMLNSWSDVSGNKMGVDDWIRTLRGYYATLNNYFKWLRPYLEQLKKKKEVYQMQARFEIIDELMEKADKMREFIQLPKDYIKAFTILELTENKLKELKVEHRMGVRLEFIEDEQTAMRRRMDRSFE